MSTMVHEQTDSVLGRAFTILSVFGSDPRPLKLCEISRRAALPKTTVHRVLAQMVDVGALERHGDHYRIGLEMFSLSAGTPEMWLRSAALPHLAELSRRFGQTIHLAVLDGDDVVYLEKLSLRATATSPSSVGGRLPAHATAAGKVLLAHRLGTGRDAIRSELPCLTARTICDPEMLRRELIEAYITGLAVDDQESAPGLRCLAHAVQYLGRSIAAVSIAHAATVRLPDEASVALRQTCVNIGRDLERPSIHETRRRQAWLDG